LKVLVTGGAGFIGSHLVDKLVEQGHSIRVIDNLSTGKLKNIQKHVESQAVDFIHGDICDTNLVKKSLANVETVFHLAAITSVPFSVENPELTMDVNLLGTINLLRSSAEEHVKKFVFASSCAVYGDPKINPVTEMTDTNPISPYAESKLMGERYCLGFFNRRLLGSVVLRFFNVYGSRQSKNEYAGVITRFLEKVRSKDNLVVYGDGSQTRDFVNIQDIVQALMLVNEKECAVGQVFNIGSGNSTSILHLANELLKLVHEDLTVTFEKKRLGDIQDSYGDISKAKELLGYKPKIALHVGLRSLIKEELAVK
jgi:UDP-glucose 4-epimerase